MRRVLKVTKYLLIIGVVLVGAAATVLDKDDYFEITKNIEIFVNVYKELNFNYVDELDPNELMRIGVDAMVGSLDPYTNFITENQVERYRLNTDGKYNGLGAKMDLVDDYFTIIEPYEKSPVLEAGMEAGDQIVEIDGLSTYQKSLDDISRIVRGAPGTSMNLKVKRFRTGEEEFITLKRGDVSIPNVPYAGEVKDDVGYIKLTTFTGGAHKNIAKELQELKEDNENLKGVILDLRNNGGGLLAEAVDICGLFLPIGSLVVTNKGKVKDRDQEYKTRRPPLDTDLPVVVLINKKSASASEIVSGVMQDYDRGVLMGQRSYGKGLVQNTKEVGYNNRVKLTTSKYYIPSRRCIQSVEYQNGEPVDIPDDRRSKFKTANGREVLDGGGVSPDIKLPAQEQTALQKALMEQHVIFKFVNEYIKDKDSIAPAGQYKFADYDAFKNYIRTNSFAYETEAEITLAKLQESTEIGLDKLIASASAKIKMAKEQALKSEQEVISDIIEQEIIGRYYYQAGKAHQALNNDKEVLAAIELINNTKKYNDILD